MSQVDDNSTSIQWPSRKEDRLLPITATLFLHLDNFRHFDSLVCSCLTSVLGKEIRVCARIHVLLRKKKELIGSPALGNILVSYKQQRARGWTR